MQENRQSTLKGIYGIGGDERYDETQRRKKAADGAGHNTVP